MNTAKIKQYTRTAAETLLVCLIVSTAADWWRKPVQPEAFARQPLTTAAGETLTLEQLGNGRTAAVYFWGTWCGACRYTSPALERLRQNGIPVLGIALRSGTPQEVAGYMRQHGLSFPVVNDESGDISGRWQIKVTPTVVLVKNGRAVHHTTGIGSYWGLRGRIWLSDLF